MTSYKDKIQMKFSIQILCLLFFVVTLAYTQDARIEDLCKNLQNHDWKTRRAAAQALGNTNWHTTQSHNAVQYLAKAVSDPNENVREAAIVALGKIGPKAQIAVPDIINALADEYDYVSQQAKFTLEKIGPANTSAVIRLIRSSAHNNPLVQKAAVTALLEIGQPAILDLIQGLNDESPEVRLSAIQILGKFGPSAQCASPHLVKAWLDTNTQIRQESAYSWVKIEPTAYQKIIHSMHDPHWEVREGIARALGDIPDLPPEMIHHLQQSENDQNPQVRNSVEQSLEKIFARTHKFPTQKQDSLQIFLIVCNILLILGIFCRSFLLLIREGHIFLRWNLPQPILFCLLYYQLFNINSHFYCYELYPNWLDWIQFTGAHILRASDVLDVFEEYQINLQNVQHNHIIPLMTIMLMHWIMDIFLITMLIQKIYHWMKKFWESKFISWLPLIFLLILIINLTLVGSVSLIDKWRYQDTLFLWPLDNIIRVVDVGDTFQLFHWCLHKVPSGTWNSFLAIWFRILMAYYVNRAIQRIWLRRVGVGTTDQFSQALQDKDTNTRIAAARNLGKLGPSAQSAIPIMVVHLADEEPRVRSEILDSLDKISPKWQNLPVTRMAISTLAEKLKQKDWHIRKTALIALGSIGTASQSVIKNIIPTLVDTELFVRSEAESALEKIAPNWGTLPITQYSLIPLVHALANSNLHVREAASNALEKIDLSWTQSIAPASPSATYMQTLFTHLSECLDNSELTVRLATVNILANASHGIKYIKPVLIQNLIAKFKQCLQDQDISIQQGIIVALGNIGEVIKSFGNIANKPPMSTLSQDLIDILLTYLPNKESGIRQAAVVALGKSGLLAVPAIHSLIAVADTYPDLREFIITTLGNIGAGAHKALLYLCNILLNDKAIPRRLAAIQAIIKIMPENKGIQTTLFRVLADPNPNIRKTAEEILEKHHPNWRQSSAIKSLIPEFIQKLGNLNQQERQASIEALGNIGAVALEAVPHLIIILATRNPMRQFVAVALGNIGVVYKNFISAYVEALSSRRCLTDDLRKIGLLWQPAILALVKTVVDNQAETRQVATSALEKIAPNWVKLPAVQSLIADLVYNLTDSDWHVRQATCALLFKINRNWTQSPAAKSRIKPLIDFLLSDDKDIRQSTVETLNQISDTWNQDSASLEILSESIKLLSDPHADINVQLIAIERLGYLGKTAYPAMQYLINAVTNSNPDIHQAAVIALKKVRGEN